MSSPRQRLELPQSLIDHLAALEKEGIAYQQAHTKDGLYDDLELQIRETLKDTHVDYVQDFSNNYTLIRYFKRRCDELEKKVEAQQPVTQYSVLQAGMAENIRRPLERLLLEVGLFKKARGLEKRVLKIDDKELTVPEFCDETLAELETLDKNSKKLMEMKV